ncbi:hypothetical protein DFH08DRAFT_976663 [Mycena albidolilacea]|uniref:Uncharacterized protein n=1 Tax=Mycena albidolilacea TaxID=1033008 RepID=A0AAD6Z266_9AGAR|nr:hypothetical protein DFH08DRAFT_976663 [Mycena albidolilacea]
MGRSSPHTVGVFDDHMNHLILGLGIPGTCLAFLVLCAYAYAAWHPVSKHHLNRVSFRLLIYALLANLTFGITLLIGTQTPGVTSYCSFVAFLTNLSLMFSAGMFFCMALNLQLTLVHSVNGMSMEKYYICGTLINDDLETCSYWNADRQLMLHWLIGTQLFWVLVMSTGEVLAFSVIIGYFISYELMTRKYRPKSESNIAEHLEHPTSSESPISMYRNVILRIGLYPLVSLLLNFSSCVIALYLVKNHTPTELNWRLWIADLAIYAVRPLVYSVLALTDPAFIRAIMAIKQPIEKSLVQQSLGFQFAAQAGSTIVHLELQAIDPSQGRKDDDTNLTWTSGHSQEPHIPDKREPNESTKTLPPEWNLSGLHSRKGSATDLNVACQM